MIYESTVTKTSDSPDPIDDIENTTLETFPPDLEIAISINDWMFYASPLSSGSAIQIGHVLSETIEVGLSGGYNYSKGKEAEEESTTIELGIYGVYALPLAWFDLELNLGLSNASIETKTRDEDGITSKSVRTEFVSEFAVDGVYHFSEHFAYVGGFFYTTGKHKWSDKVEKSLVQSTGINIASFRYSF